MGSNNIDGRYLFTYLSVQPAFGAGIYWLALPNEIPSEYKGRADIVFGLHVTEVASDDGPRLGSLELFTAKPQPKGPNRYFIASPGSLDKASRDELVRWVQTDFKVNWKRTAEQWRFDIAQEVQTRLPSNSCSTWDVRGLLKQGARI